MHAILNISSLSVAFRDNNCFGAKVYIDSGVCNNLTKQIARYKTYEKDLYKVFFRWHIF